jgi:hypothetical protein
MRSEPIMQSADEWDANMELDIAIMIRRYLNENPPPPGARLAHDAAKWATQLECAGTARAQALGQVRRLRPVRGCAA